MTQDNVRAPEFTAPTIGTTDESTASFGSAASSGGAEGGSSSTGSGKQQAKEEAAALGQTAAEAGKDVLGTARSELAGVAEEAGTQLSDLWSQARGELTELAAGQQTKVADALSTFGSDLSRMADASEQQGAAAGVVRAIAERSQGAGSWLSDRDGSAALDELRSFARRRPGAFLLAAAGAGVLVGRLTRGLRDGSGEQSSGATQGAPRTTSSVDQPYTGQADALVEPTTGLAGVGQPAGFAGTSTSGLDEADAWSASQGARGITP